MQYISEALQRPLRKHVTKAQWFFYYKQPSLLRLLELSNVLWVVNQGSYGWQFLHRHWSLTSKILVNTLERPGASFPQLIVCRSCSVSQTYDMTAPVMHHGSGDEVMREKEKEIKRNRQRDQETTFSCCPIFFPNLKYSPEFNYPNLDSQRVEFEEHL